MFRDHPEAYTTAVMTHELENRSERIEEDGKGWMAFAQAIKMMNDEEVGSAMCAEAKRRENHFKINQWGPELDKAQLYLVPLTTKELARQFKSETKRQRFEADADMDDAADIAMSVHAASAFVRDSSTGTGQPNNPTPPGGLPAGKDEATLRKDAEEKAARAAERERIKNLPVNKAERWITTCNTRLSDLSAFDHKVNQAK